MVGPVLLAGGVVYVAKEYYELRKILDVYPEKLNDTVEKIKKSIDLKTYEYLTNQLCSEELNNPAIELVSDGYTKVVKFKDSPDFVVKTSIVGLNLDIRTKLNEEPFGRNYVTSNSEGGVTRDFFRYANRVREAKKLRKIIKENDLDRIKVPKKYLCSFPPQLVSEFSTPFYNRHVFVLCERCDVEYVGERTVEELEKMNESDMQILANQIHTFISKSGILDFLPHNFYIKEGKLVIFDTEPMSLTSLQLPCISPSLRIARINFKNIERNFERITEAKILVDTAKQSITHIKKLERKRVYVITSLAIVVLGTFVFLNYFSLLHHSLQFSTSSSVPDESF